MTGHTLVEGLVVITIISILAVITLTAWPRVRDRQAALLAEQNVQSLVRRAQQKAFHEERSEDCLALFGEDDEEQRRCSDIGIAFRGQEAQIFADTVGDDNRKDDDDFVVEEHRLPAGVVSTEEDWQAFLFKATPPRITLFNAAGEVVAADEHATLTINAGRLTLTLAVFPYGQVQLEEPDE